MTTQTSPRSQWLVLAGFVAAVAVVAVVGSLAATSASEIYGDLKQPTWAPPSWLFGPVWTVLYVLIAVSGWLYRRENGTRQGLALYGVGLALNAIWTPLFFAGGAFGVALAAIILLDVVVIATILLFRRRSRVAAALQLPYLAWILFATTLNATILTLN